MLINVATWNTQGFNQAKADLLAQFMRQFQVVMVQEAGALADYSNFQGNPVVGWSGVDTDGYGNNVSRGLTIVHQWCVQQPPSDHDPVFATIQTDPSEVGWFDRARIWMNP